MAFTTGGRGSVRGDEEYKCRVLEGEVAWRRSSQGSVRVREEEEEEEEEEGEREKWREKGLSFWRNKKLVANMEWRAKRGEKKV